LPLFKETSFLFFFLLLLLFFFFFFFFSFFLFFFFSFHFCFWFVCFKQDLEQKMKVVENLQDDFDFNYKTLKSQGGK
jgi:hypothetical protein